MLFPARRDVADIEAVRRRWDPVMAARIGLHLTLVHDVTDRAAAAYALERCARARAPFSVGMTETARWGRGRGVYVGVEDPSGAVASLHSALAPFEDPRWLRHGFRPHVTVVHGRYVDEQTADAAWAELRAWSPRRDLLLDRVAVVEMDVDGWETVAEIPLTG